MVAKELLNEKTVVQTYTEFKSLTSLLMPGFLTKILPQSIIQTIRAKEFS